MSKVLVTVDMEGAAGISDVKECFLWYPEYRKHGLVQLACDVNAVVRGPRAGGIDDIFVCDMRMFSLAKLCFTQLCQLYWARALLDGLGKSINRQTHEVNLGLRTIPETFT